MHSYDKKTILHALSTLNSLAQENDTTIELCIYGGVAFMLAYDSRNATKDVDAIIKPSELGKKLAKEVAKKLNLHDDWLNDDVKQFIGYTEQTRSLSQFSDWDHLKITVPVADYLLAMKALACREPLPGHEGDINDLKFLIDKMKIRSVDDIQKKIDKYFADDVLTEKQRKRLETLITDERK